MYCAAFSGSTLSLSREGSGKCVEVFYTGQAGNRIAGVLIIYNFIMALGVKFNDQIVEAKRGSHLNNSAVGKGPNNYAVYSMQ